MVNTMVNTLIAMSVVSAAIAIPDAKVATSGGYLTQDVFLSTAFSAYSPAFSETESFRGASTNTAVIYLAGNAVCNPRVKVCEE